MFSLSPSLQQLVEKNKSIFERILKECLKVKKEEILIVSDYGTAERQLPAMMSYGYYLAAQKQGLLATILHQDIKKGFMQADTPIFEALQRLPSGNIVLLCLSNKLGRLGEDKSFRSFAQERRHRFISSTGLGDVLSSRFETFLEAMNINYKRLQKKGLSIKKLWDKAKQIRVTTEAGTDVTFIVEGMEAIANVGIYDGPGKGGNIPTGEVYIPPQGVEGVEGKVVIDATIKTADGARLIDEPVILTIEKGKVIRMEGKYASLLEETFQRFEDRAEHPERVRLVSELAIGINPGAVLIGSMIIDEKVLGTGHIAIGSNSWFGGPIKTLFHGDQVFKDPTFYLDGKKMEV